MDEKTDKQIRAEIYDKINERLDNIEMLLSENQQVHELRIAQKDRDIEIREKEILKLVKALDDVYNHNEACRAAVKQYYGLHHNAVVREIQARRAK